MLSHLGCLQFLPLAYLLNRLAEFQAVLFQYDKHPFILLPSRRTGNQHLICSLPSESAEKSLMSFISCLHHKVLDVDIRLV